MKFDPQIPPKGYLSFEILAPSSPLSCCLPPSVFLPPAPPNMQRGCSCWILFKCSHTSDVHLSSHESVLLVYIQKPEVSNRWIPECFSTLLREDLFIGLDLPKWQANESGPHHLPRETITDVCHGNLKSAFSASAGRTLPNEPSLPPLVGKDLPHICYFFFARRSYFCFPAGRLVTSSSGDKAWK